MFLVSTAMHLMKSAYALIIVNNTIVLALSYLFFSGTASMADIDASVVGEFSDILCEQAHRGRSHSNSQNDIFYEKGLNLFQPDDGMLLLVCLR